jgi:hypothetical protein
MPVSRYWHTYNRREGGSAPKAKPEVDDQYTEAAVVILDSTDLPAAKPRPCADTT